MSSSAARRRFAARAALASALAALGALGGCAGDAAREPVPAPALARTHDAQAEFRAIHLRWLAMSPRERLTLKEALQRFLGRHARDDRARLARVYLAFIQLEQGDLVQARALAAETRAGAPGAVADLATVAEAAVLVREGHAERALELLEPLRGKIVDPLERMTFGEEYVRAGLRAHRWLEAVFAMEEWLAHASQDEREAVMDSIEELLQRVPPGALERGLEALAASPRGSEASPRVASRTWLRKAVSSRLSRIALAEKDPELAERLLDAGARGHAAGALARLAAGGTAAPRVSGRAVGLVLSLRDARARRRSAAVAAGLSRALGLPAADRDPARVRLVTRDDAGEAGGIARALGGLASDGAVILIAGTDAGEARSAAAWAESASVPVVLLAVPERTPDDPRFTFVLGAEPAATETTLGAELARRGLSPLARVGSGGADCEAEPALAGRPRFPVQAWKRDRVAALELLGDAECARDAIAEARAAKLEPVLALGLDCAELITEPARGTRIAVAAGSFPWRPEAAAPADLGAWRERTGAAPSWWAALGHDAGALAAQALRDFPLQVVEDPRAVAALHARAQSRLAGARAELWSTDRRGFESGRRIERSLTTVAVAGEPERAAR